jgi:hypothetical protein
MTRTTGAASDVGWFAIIKSKLQARMQWPLVSAAFSRFSQHGSRLFGCILCFLCSLQGLFQIILPLLWMETVDMLDVKASLFPVGMTKALKPFEGYVIIHQ